MVQRLERAHGYFQCYQSEIFCMKVREFLLLLATAFQLLQSTIIIILRLDELFIFHSIFIFNVCIKIDRLFFVLPSVILDS